MAMKDTSKTVFNFLKECDGDNVTLNDIATSLGMPARSVNGCLVGMQKKKLIVREETTAPGADGKDVAVKYIRLTVEGRNFNPDAE